MWRGGSSGTHKCQKRPRNRPTKENKRPFKFNIPEASFVKTFSRRSLSCFLSSCKNKLKNTHGKTCLHSRSQMSATHTQYTYTHTVCHAYPIHIHTHCPYLTHIYTHTRSRAQKGSIFIKKMCTVLERLILFFAVTMLVQASFWTASSPAPPLHF